MREAAVLSSPSDALETPHARTLTWFRLEDAAFHAVTKAAAVAVLLVLGSVIVALVYGALPAFRAFGWDFLISARWNPVTEKFGALAPIYGTVVTSLLAMLIAVPVGLGVAIFLTELCPRACGGRSASPSSCSPASRALSTASGDCSSSPRSCSRPCSRP